MYSEKAPIAYDLILSARGKDYRREAEVVAEQIRRHRPDALSVLDVACGTGRHLAALADLGFETTGMDISAPMLEVARTRLPDGALHHGDMRSFRLDRRFDAVVCLFGSISYMTTTGDLDRALSTMAAHVAGPGPVIVEPWTSPEHRHPAPVSADSAKGRELAAARVSRSWQEGDVRVTEVRYSLATPQRSWSFTEQHRMGTFEAPDLVAAFQRAGLNVQREHVSEVRGYSEPFVGYAPTAPTDGTD